MSSDSVSTGSTLGQFGLYRSIDARTEEFLRLSKRKQIRRGCACAAVSTAITVTVVVIILLIYEYVIAVQWSVVQRKTRGNRNNEPYAERLDRSYFGFDQDYYEQMPLLLNSLQENNYVDPSLDIIPPSRNSNKKNLRTSTSKPSYKYNSVRRTSPRPFFFEYRSPSPLPFSKTYGSKSWVERYRNDERLQNIRKVIKYLEKTINAKMGDMYTKPPSNSIAFTGLYVEPMMDKTKKVDNSAEIDLILEGSDKAHAFIKTKHQSDPLFNYKPDSPGEVNLLADAFLRFSPIPTPRLYDDITTNAPVYITKNYRRCFGKQCNENINNIADILNTDTTTHSYTDTSLKNTKSFSVMLNLYPFKTTTSSLKSTEPTKHTKSNLDNIYFTTRKPSIQFRRKSIFPVRRYVLKKKPRQLIQNKTKTENNVNENEDVSATKMLVHVNVYSPDSKIGQNNTNFFKESENLTTTGPAMTSEKHYYTTEANVNPDKVEDFHVGSSGILPVTTEIAPFIPILPLLTTMPPILEPTKYLNENYWTTNTPDVVKFNEEDAKIPDHYIELKKLSSLTTEINNLTEIRRNFLENDKELSTLIVKLKNFVTTVETTEESTDIEEEEISTTQTYVPQINGHYRNTNPNMRNAYIRTDNENNRKRRLEASVTDHRKPYVEIKRKTTVNYDD
ncbi:hypothetical protein K1T71_004762 [Dendrolimus kikuchii]|uniref:Uncharacterized protein n=1 Tax=Dendrolimus kikuchii TaxID=765133 RepID=A0ACC1D8L6_9NEOP|nr:hypothetical protein K1T71_004762 [Dendrolimus kikuchii]